MSSIFKATFTSLNGKDTDVIYIGMADAVQVEADSEMSRYGCRSVAVEQIGHSRYTAKEGDLIVIVGG